MVKYLQLSNVNPDQCPAADQGCRMVYFHTKNLNLSKFWMVLEWKMLVYFTANSNILRPLGIYCGHSE
jgi:hypothetical protein